MPRRKQPRTNFPNRLTVVHKPLLTKGKQKFYGLSFQDDALVEIDPNQHPKDYLDTYIHETLHILFPEWEEEEVFDLATFLAENLWEHGYRRIHQEDEKTIFDVYPDGQDPVPKYKKDMNSPLPIKSTQFDKLKDEYSRMFNECKVLDSARTDKLVSKLVAKEDIYKQVGIAPWYWIGCIHMMEASQDFTCHLHNGDPLKKRTKSIPAGRPAAPPDTIYGYSWETSAKDALYLKGLDKWGDWSVSGMLYQTERYNGWGYRMYKSNFSPYLWCGSQFWTKGKYVMDGKYDPSATSKQIGVAVILKRMVELDIISI